MSKQTAARSTLFGYLDRQRSTRQSTHAWSRITGGGGGLVITEGENKSSTKPMRVRQRHY